MPVYSRPQSRHGPGPLLAGRCGPMDMHTACLAHVCMLGPVLGTAWAPCWTPCWALGTVLGTSWAPCWAPHGHRAGHRTGCRHAGHRRPLRCIPQAGRHGLSEMGAACLPHLCMLTAAFSRQFILGTKGRWWVAQCDAAVHWARGGAWKR